MLPSLTEAVRGAAMICGELEPRPLRIPLEWTTTSFPCSIHGRTHPVETADGADHDAGPVRLRVNEAKVDSCRVEIFCAEAHLCRASAGR